MIETERLRLRRLTLEDAEFILRLLNEPSFIDNIGDRAVRTVDDARAYLRRGPLSSYDQHGFGLFLVESKVPVEPIGLCGLLKREILEDVDIGYAFLPEVWSQGFATESAAAVMEYAANVLALRKVVAVTNSDNWSSIRLLERIGFHYERMVQLVDGEPEIKLFAKEC